MIYDKQFTLKIGKWPSKKNSIMILKKLK